MIGRITDDGRILPVSVTEGLVPPEPWSPWLTRPSAASSRCRRASSRPQPAAGLSSPPAQSRGRIAFPDIALTPINNAATNRVYMTSTKTLERF